MERAGHYIDMRLGRPIEYIDMFNRTGLVENRWDSRQWIIRQLEAVEGVARVSLSFQDTDGDAGMGLRSGSMMGRFGGREAGSMGMRFHRAVFTKITPPHHDTTIGTDTVSLVSELLDENAKTIGRLVVVVRFDYLIADIISLGWWQSQVAGIVDTEGRYLVHTEIIEGAHDRLGETGDPLELRVRQMLGESSGTVFGSGHPPETVAGFHRLQQAPWTIVMFASGEKLLGPIIHFRNFFFAGWAAFALLLLALLRVNVAHIAGPVRILSKSAEAVSHGDYGQPLKSHSEDEIGQLIGSYNRMVEGLKERDLIRDTFGRYIDPNVARKLLSRPEYSRMGGVKRKVVVLMADIRDFTSLAERLDPDTVIRMLNHYFSAMIATVHRHAGIIVDFIGDGLLVFFEPLDETFEKTASRAFHCACDMQARMTNLNLVLQAEKLPSLHAGVGLNAGEVIVGNIGSDQRTKYGIVGAAVNLTQRIQAQAGPEEIVISASVLGTLIQQPRILRQFDASVKGVSDPITLYVVDNNKRSHAEPSL